MPIKKLFWILILLFWACESDISSQGSSGPDGFNAGTGLSGSMTRFAVYYDYIFVVDNAAIQIFSIATNNFDKLNEVHIEFGLETIFATEGYLYLGANDAMYIYALENPAEPQFLFRYEHVTSCDPVVVQGNRAYITMRSGTECNLGANSLEILDITNKTSPSLILTYPLQNPHGLGVLGNQLFVCEGAYGISRYDISNEQNILLLDKIESVHAYDVIVRDGSVIVTGSTGVYQFSTVEDQMELMSMIPVLAL